MGIITASDGRILASCRGVIVEIPGKIEGQIEQLMNACETHGREAAKAEIRDALGVDEAIRREGEAILSTVLPTY